MILINTKLHYLMVFLQRFSYSGLMIFEKNNIFRKSLLFIFVQNFKLLPLRLNSTVGDHYLAPEIQVMSIIQKSFWYIVLDLIRSLVLCVINVICFFFISLGFRYSVTLNSEFRGNFKVKIKKKWLNWRLQMLLLNEHKSICYNCYKMFE